MQLPRGEGLQCLPVVEVSLSAAFTKESCNVKSFWDSSRTESHKVQAINHLNQTFPECLRKRQIPMPDLRPTEPRPLVDQT